MVSGINSDSQGVEIESIVNQLIVVGSSDEIIRQVAQKLFDSIEGSSNGKLNPNRVSNALVYIVEQVETIQIVEKLVLSFNRKDIESIKSLLLELKELPDGVVSHSAIHNDVFSIVTDLENSELLDFFFDNFMDRLNMDLLMVCDAVKAYAFARNEEKAIAMLDHIGDTTFSWNVYSLLEDVEHLGMENLTTQLREIYANSTKRKFDF